MASITADANGRKRIQFIGTDGKRKAVRIGKATQRQAEAFKVKLEMLVSGCITGSTDDETSRWLAGLDETMHSKLASVRLTAERESHRLGPWLESYIAGRTDVKPGTRTHLGHTKRNLVQFFGADRPIRSITEGDADEWRRYLIDRKLGKNTVRRRCGIAKQFFRAAIRKKLLVVNPFADLKVAHGTDLR